MIIKRVDGGRIKVIAVDEQCESTVRLVTTGVFKSDTADTSESDDAAFIDMCFRRGYRQGWFFGFIAGISIWQAVVATALYYLW